MSDSLVACMPASQPASRTHFSGRRVRTSRKHTFHVARTRARKLRPIHHHHPGHTTSGDHKETMGATISLSLSVSVHNPTTLHTFPTSACARSSGAGTSTPLFAHINLTHTRASLHAHGGHARVVDDAVAAFPHHRINTTILRMLLYYDYHTTKTPTKTALWCITRRAAVSMFVRSLARFRAVGAGGCRKS